MAACLALSLCLHALGAVVLSMLPSSSGPTSPPTASVDPGAHSIQITLVPTPPEIEPTPPRIEPPVVTPAPRPLAPPPIKSALATSLPPIPIDLASLIAPRIEKLPMIQVMAPGNKPTNESPTKIAPVSAPVPPAPLPKPKLDAPARPDIALPSEHAKPQPSAASTEIQEDDAGASKHAEIVGDISPRYPSLSRRRGEQGLVVLKVHVLPTGRVDDVRVLRDPGHRRLVDAAIKAVRSAKFTPAMRQGKPVASWLETPVRFVLQ